MTIKIMSITKQFSNNNNKKIAKPALTLTKTTIKAMATAMNEQQKEHLQQQRKNIITNLMVILTESVDLPLCKTSPRQV